MREEIVIYVVYKRKRDKILNLIDLINFNISFAGKRVFQR